MSDAARAVASVHVLTWNSAELVEDAVASVLAQTAGPLDVLVCDNASADGTPWRVARRFGERVRVVCYERNTGYAEGHNRAIALSDAPFVVVLNPDVRLAPTFIERALAAFDDPRVGIVAGRLMRADGVTVDSTGQFLARARRPIDRGFGRPLDPARDVAGPVLGACGAAAVYRRAMIDDIADDGAFFDEDYFAYFEDLEVAWRAWRAGWKAVHVPDAEAIHLRGGGAPRGRLGMMFDRPTPVLAHIVKNRYLAMLRHDRPAALLRDLPHVAAREVAQWALILGTRPAVVRELWRVREAFARAWHKRRADRARGGRWGAWRRDVPPRGMWRPVPGGAG